jgi:hypothetical protein
MADSDWVLPLKIRPKGAEKYNPKAAALAALANPHSDDEDDA